MRTLVQKMHKEGGFAVITEETTLRDLERLRTHPGKRTAAEAISRRLFFHGFDIADRIQRLLTPELVSMTRTCLKKATRTRQRPPAEKLVRLRRHLTSREWITYIQSLKGD
ncbi:MAG: hypothetical protein ACOYM3_24750 [Terrimicrobiaceae bacterium]